MLIGVAGAGKVHCFYSPSLPSRLLINGIAAVAGYGAKRVILREDRDLLCCIRGCSVSRKSLSTLNIGNWVAVNKPHRCLNVLIRA